MYGTGLGSGLTGLTCGQSPCTWWDDVYLTQTCQSYLQECDPMNPLLTLVNKGLIVGGAQVIGSTAGSAVGDFAGSAVSSASAGLVESSLPAFTNPDGTLNWTTLGLVSLGLFVLLKVITK